MSVRASTARLAAQRQGKIVRKHVMHGYRHQDTSQLPAATADAVSLHTHNRRRARSSSSRTLFVQLVTGNTISGGQFHAPK